MSKQHLKEIRGRQPSHELVLRSQWKTQSVSRLLGPFASGHSYREQEELGVPAYLGECSRNEHLMVLRSLEHSKDLSELKWSSEVGFFI